MRLAVLVTALVTAACASPEALSGRSPVVAATPTISTPSAGTMTAPPTRLPGSVVRMSVNGVDEPVNTGLRATGDGPVTIVFTFPFAMDRQSVEQYPTPAATTKTWLDDRTYRLEFPETGVPLEFKMAELRSASGDAVIDFLGVSIVFPAARVVSVYTINDLGASRQPRPSSAWRIRANDGLTLSPDAKRVLLFDALSPIAGQIPTFIELDTKKTTVLAQPPASEGWFSFADWMADGRLVMVGRGVWVGDTNANGMKRIADATAAVSGYPWFAFPDPTEARLALWGYNTDGHIAVIDLRTGVVQRLTGPFRRCAADGGVSLAWSADGRRIAGTDCDSEEGPAKGRVRIVDVVTDRTLRTIEGGVYTVTGLTDGSFMLVKDSGETGAGARLLGLVMDFEGREHRRYLGGGWQMSPDRRYLLQSELSPAGCCGFTLFDLTGGTSFEFIVPSSGQGDGWRGSPRWMRDGRLAFY